MIYKVSLAMLCTGVPLDLQPFQHMQLLQKLCAEGYFPTFLIPVTCRISYNRELYIVAYKCRHCYMQACAPGLAKYVHVCKLSSCSASAFKAQEPGLSTLISSIRCLSSCPLVAGS